MAGLIPRDFIDTLLTRVDIIDVIDSRVPLTKKGKDYMACCPFHDEKTPSFSVSQPKQFFYCFGCQERGNAIDFLMKHENRPFPEAVEELASIVGLEVPRDGSGPSPEQRAQTDGLLEIVAEANAWYQEQLKTHPDREQASGYLKGRGLSGEIAKSFGIGFAPDAWDNLSRALGTSKERLEQLDQAGLVSERSSGAGHYDRLRGRVIFPIEDHRGRVVGFGGRVLGDGEPKYLNSPETPLFHKGSELYGLFRGRKTFDQTGRAIVVEGYMDVIALAQYEIEGAVATMGTATTKAHLERLFRLVTEVVFCFDGDRAGRKAAWKALDTSLPLLTNGRQVSFLFLPDGEDPDSIVRAGGAAAFRERADNATALPEFLFDELASDIDLGRIDGRARYVEAAKPYISKLPAGVLRDLIVEQLAQLARTNVETLERTLAGETRSIATSAPPVRARPKRAGERLEPLSRAISIALQQPAVTLQDLNYDQLIELQRPGVDMLMEIIDAVADSPEIGPAALLERFRDHRFHERLEELATWPHVLEDSFETDFVAVIDKLLDTLLRDEIDALKDRISAGDATEDEKQLYIALLNQRNGPN